MIMIKRGTLCTILGLLLLLAALLLTAYNLRRDAAAGDAAELVLERLTPDLPRQESLSQSPTGEGKEEAFVPDYVLNPELPMPGTRDRWPELHRRSGYPRARPVAPHHQHMELSRPADRTLPLLRLRVS